MYLEGRETEREYRTSHVKIIHDAEIDLEVSLKKKAGKLN